MGKHISIAKDLKIKAERSAFAEAADNLKLDEVAKDALSEAFKVDSVDVKVDEGDKKDGNVVVDNVVVLVVHK